MLIERRDGSVAPDYFQFYLKASNADHASDHVTGEGYETHLEAPSPGFVYVGTLTKFLTTPVRVEVHDTEPAVPGTEWQHVAEVSLTNDGVIDVLSGRGMSPSGSQPLRVRSGCVSCGPVWNPDCRRDFRKKARAGSLLRIGVAEPPP
jgi:hypothetical protein